MPQTLGYAARAQRAAHSAVNLDSLERTAAARSTVRRVFRLLVQAIVLVGLISLFFVRVPQVEGRSMLPAIEDGDHVLISTLACGVTLGPLVITRGAIRRGDIVAFERRRGDARKIFLKRVLALPGEKVELRDGKVLVADVPVLEPYGPLPDRWNMKPLVVPAGSVFVLGDNRAESNDSRVFGPVAESSIGGLALFVIWPIAHAKRIR